MALNHRDRTRQARIDTIAMSIEIYHYRSVVICHITPYAICHQYQILPRFFLEQNEMVLTLGVESLEDDYLIEGDDNSHSNLTENEIEINEEEIEGKEELRKVEVENKKKNKKKNKKNKKFNHLTFSDYGMENGVKMEYSSCKEVSEVVRAGAVEMGNNEVEESTVNTVLQPKWCNIIDSSMILFVVCSNVEIY